MNRKRILLIGGNFYPEPTGIGKFNGEMIRWFAQNGWDCTVISTAPYYPHWKVQKPYSNYWFRKEVITTKGRNIDVFRCPHFIPSKPSGSKRLLSEASFSISSLFALIHVLFKKKFDYVITVAPPFQLGFLALIYNQFKSAKFLYHIQDLQIEAARDLNMVQSKKLIKVLFLLEKKILQRADVVSSISPGMLQKIKEKTKGEVSFFPNWVDIQSFYPITNGNSLKQQFGFQLDDKVVLYSGAIGEKQGLEIILKTAETLKFQKNIHFVICGSGPYKEKLQQLASKAQLSQVHFFPLQASKTFNAFLNMADVHLVIQKEHAGDLVMPSKLTNILAIGGLAVVTAAKLTSLYTVINENRLGLLVQPEDAEDLSQKVLKAVNEDNHILKQNARLYAEKFLAIDPILSGYAERILQLNHSSSPVTARSSAVPESVPSL